MSLGSSMNAGVLGLQANSARLATISENIANNNTNGYKRAEIDFSTVVLAEPGAFTAGGVTTNVHRNIGQHGLVESTGNSTDISVNGRGFIPVVQSQTPENLDSGRDKFRLASTGSFRPDVDGNLVTSSHYLLGFKLDQTGATVNPAIARNSFDALEVVNIGAGGFTASPTTLIEFAGNLPAQDTEATSSGDPRVLPVEYFDELGNSESLTLTFTPVIPGVGASGNWLLTITDSADGSTVGDFDIQFNLTGANAGSLASVTPTTGAYDTVTGALTMTVAGGNDIDITIGTADAGDGLVQFAGEFAPLRINKDGAGFGNILRVEIGEDGVVDAIFDNGQSRPIYQIPVADVINPNGMQLTEGNVFQLTQNSGGLFLFDSGQGPVGTTEGFALENSTVDIAQELTDLIQTQRSYSSNARIITTVDEMLQETTNLKR
jgi:flagellar hook protein FlgE